MHIDSPIQTLLNKVIHNKSKRKNENKTKWTSPYGSPRQLSQQLQMFHSSTGSSNQLLAREEQRCGGNSRRLPPICHGGPSPSGRLSQSLLWNTPLWPFLGAWIFNNVLVMCWRKRSRPQDWSLGEREEHAPPSRSTGTMPFIFITHDTNIYVPTQLLKWYFIYNECKGFRSWFFISFGLRIFKIYLD